jgi:hypothetical protein
MLATVVSECSIRFPNAIGRIVLSPYSQPSVLLVFKPFALIGYGSIALDQLCQQGRTAVGTELF